MISYRDKRSVSELPPSVMPIEQMYYISSRKDHSWGIEGYQMPVQNIDPLKMMSDREMLKIKKGQKDKRRVLKKGHYLEDLQKSKNFIPGPSKYSLPDEWASDKSKKPNSAPPKKLTFIDEIFKNGKLRATPGVGKYNVIKTQEEIRKDQEEMQKRKIKVSDKPNFLNDFEVLSSLAPGPGNYNPHDVIPKFKVNNMKPDQWITKHKEENKRLAKIQVPDVGTYKPHPVSYQSFGRLLMNVEEDKKQIQQKKLWGNDERFPDIKKSKSLNKTTIPGPGAYPLLVSWKGKEEGAKKDNRKSYMDSTTKGTVRSIYY